MVGDAANRLQAFGGGSLQFGKRKRFAGPALTVRVRPGNNLFLHKAIDPAQSGDVLVVDAGGALNTAIISAMMSNYATGPAGPRRPLDPAGRPDESATTTARWWGRSPKWPSSWAGPRKSTRSNSNGKKQITGGTWDRTWVDQALAKL